MAHARLVHVRALAALVAVMAVACGSGAAPAATPAPAAEFRNHRRVTITGYEGSAMEPFISCDGRYLLFNNRNDPGELTDLFVAEASGDAAFRSLGEIAGANAPPPALDGVPSLDARGELFFVSTRSYESTLATLYTGEFRDGRVSGVRLVAGNVAVGQRGWLTMDAEISRDGGLLYFANARFTGGNVPAESDLSVARRAADGFTVLSDATTLFANLNSRALEYAPATSADGLEIFFTRLEGLSAVILRATRPALSAAFSSPAPVGGVTGFAEAPTLTCDGNTLYYHRLDGRDFVLYRADRVR